MLFLFQKTLYILDKCKHKQINDTLIKANLNLTKSKNDMEQENQKLKKTIAALQEKLEKVNREVEDHKLALQLQLSSLSKTEPIAAKTMEVRCNILENSNSMLPLNQKDDHIDEIYSPLIIEKTSSDAAETDDVITF